MIAFTVTVELKDGPGTAVRWAQTFTPTVDTEADLEQLVSTDGGLVLDGLDAAWQLKEWPGQPDPTELTFSLYVPDVDTGPRPEQGDTVRVVIEPPGYDPAQSSFYGPVLDFEGRVTDADATVLRDGLSYDVVAVDYTADLGEESIGDEPWPEDLIFRRVETIMDASELPFVWSFDADNMAGSSEGANTLKARDVDSQPTGALLEDTLRQWAMWQGLGYPNRIGDTATVRDPSRDGPLQYWGRAYVIQQLDPNTGSLSFTLKYQTPRAPSPSALPYRLYDTGAGSWALEVRADSGALPADDGAVWLPAAAVDRHGLRWRQDKAAVVNRVRARADGGFIGPRGGTRGSWVSKWPHEIAVNGPVEQRVEVTTGLYPSYLTPMLLGAEYDAQPRYHLDELRIVPDELPTEQWPRLFPRREPTSDYFDGAPGRFVFLYGIDGRWNLGRRGEYFGQLAGARLSVRKGTLRLTARLVHRKPGPNGPSGSLTWQQLTYLDASDPDGPFWAEIAADTTWLDLALTDTA